MNKNGMGSIQMLLIQSVSILLVVLLIGALVLSINKMKQEGFSIPKRTIGLSKTGFEIRDITGFSIDDNHSDIEGFTISLKPLAGSDPINLEKTQVYIQIGNRSASLNIVNGTTSRDVQEGYYTD